MQFEHRSEQTHVHMTANKGKRLTSTPGGKAALDCASSSPPAAVPFQCAALGATLGHRAGRLRWALPALLGFQFVGNFPQLRPDLDELLLDG